MFSEALIMITPGNTTIVKQKGDKYEKVFSSVLLHQRQNVVNV